MVVNLECPLKQNIYKLHKGPENTNFTIKNLSIFKMIIDLKGKTLRNYCNYLSTTNILEKMLKHCINYIRITDM